MKYQIYFYIFLYVLILSACSSPQYSASTTGWDYYSESQGGYTTGNYDEFNRVEYLSKLTYSAALTMKVDDVEKANKECIDISNNYGGYASNISGSTITIFVPAQKFDEVYATLKLLGKLNYFYIKVNNETINYQNLSLRLENADKTLKRYQELLQTATTVEEKLKVEKEIERLNLDILKINALIIDIEKQVAYSSFDVTLQQKVKPGILGYVFKGLYKSVKWLFVWEV